MGLLVSLPIGPKRTAVIHLALSTLWRTSMKDEKETLLARRQGDVAMITQAFLLQSTLQSEVQIWYHIANFYQNSR